MQSYNRLIGTQIHFGSTLYQLQLRREQRLFLLPGTGLLVDDFGGNFYCGGSRVETEQTQRKLTLVLNFACSLYYILPDEENSKIAHSLVFSH